MGDTTESFNVLRLQKTCFFLKSQKLRRDVPTVREAKRVSWQAYVTGINRFTSLTDVWNHDHRIAGRCPSTPIPGLKVGGDTILNIADVANVFGRHLTEQPEFGSRDAGFQRNRTLSEARPADFGSSVGQSYNRPFSMAELKAAIARTRDTPPGPDSDRITNMMLRALSDESLAKLLLVERPENKRQDGDGYPAARALLGLVRTLPAAGGGGA